MQENKYLGRKSKEIIYLICALIICSFTGFAQISYLGTPNIKNYTRADYQAGTQNWSIGQNDNGLMFFGNNKGLVIFDGYQWQTVTLPNKTILRSFAFAEQNKIYVGGQNELGFFSITENGSRKYHSLIKDIKEESKSFEDIWKVFNMSGKIIFCSKKAIFIYEQDKLVNTILPETERFENFFEIDNILYVQDLNQGIFRYSFQSQKFEPFILHQELTNQRIIELLKIGEELYAITSNSGIFKIGLGLLSPVRNEAAAFLIKNQAYCAAVLNDGSIAVGTVVNGLIKFDASGEILMHINKKNGLMNNTILSVFQDVHENLWLGLDNGIDYAETNSAFLDLGSESGVEGTGYVAYLDDDKMYLGTNQGLYYADLDEMSKSTNDMQFMPIENSSGQIWNIQEIGNRVIVGRHEGAAYLENGRLIPFSNIEGAWKFLQLNDHPEFAIEGTYTGFALYRNMNINKPNVPDEWQFVKMLEGFDESARVFEQDREGYIWVSHAYKGLYRIKLTDEVDKIEDISFYTVEDGLPDSLFLNVVTIKKEIVVTSPHGIYKFDHDSNSFVVHDELSAIFHGGANVHRLLEDKNGNIWFSIDNEFGILKIEEEGLLNNIEIAYFNQVQEDLVDGFEYVYALDTEHVLIGTENGFVLYKSQLLKTTDFPFGVLVREVSTTAGQDSIVFVDNGAPLKDLPKFKWVNNDLRFTYAAPYFDKIDNVVYRYQLVGFDEGWSEWSDRTEKEYTNLEDKKYMFEVQAKNAYGTVSDVKTFEFKVMPPWYKTLLAKIFYAIAGTLLLFGLLRNVSIREKKKTESFKREQEQKLLKKEQEFKKETERSENEIVRLRNEKLRADVVHKNSELASATMHLVQKSEILLKLKNDIKLIAKDSPEPVNKELRRILRTIDSDIQLDENWDKFESFFDKVHEDFFKRLRHKFPDLTPKDQKLCAYLRMNLTTKEIAPLLNISVRGVEISRYRLRKKLELDSSINLVSYIMDI